MANKLYITPTIPINSLKDLIDCLYLDRISKERGFKARPTYIDKELTRIDCLSARRSFEDLLVLARTYFPDTTEVDLMETLVNLKITFGYCPDIFKIVFAGRHLATIRPLHFQAFVGTVRLTNGTYTAKSLDDIYNQIKI